MRAGRRTERLELEARMSSEDRPVDGAQQNCTQETRQVQKVAPYIRECKSDICGLLFVIEVLSQSAGE